MTIYSIYKAVNVNFNEKIYIGYDKQWPARQKSHYKESVNKNQPHYWYFFHKAMRNFEFEWEVIYQSKSLDDIKQKEKDFIIEYNSHYIKGIGYNMTDGGDGFTGGITSKKTKELQSTVRISKLLSGDIVPWNKGLTLSDNRVKINGFNRSKIWFVTSPEHIIYEIRNLSQFCRDNNLSYDRMMKVARGVQVAHKRWKCARTSPNSQIPVESDLNILSK